ncbi:S1 family peptidase [Streptomyces sp. WI04-05B]|uniref:S1 family peptidase n=1 Tax=Streptomyces TaxID=1883 RepID=UPI0029A6049C|nr:MULTISPECIES: trypsin-like serine protease [unclassified Streptomyces]MDX2548367.1 trypsin-like serine protease [Streptomyces sp. WI04-05B]MDX2590303.1 trypsin-like serine protease [Streptomyces sp. WI04-05A]
MRTNPRRRTAFAALVTAAAIGAPALPAHAVTGPAETDNTLGFTARLDIGNGTKACSGALVAPEWLITAASCFATNPAASLAVPAGKPALKTTATIGRTDLTTTNGQVRDVVELVPHADRDLVLARLARPVPNVTPVALSATAPAAGEELRVAGYGRTKDEWAPLKLHTGAFTVNTVEAARISVADKDGAAVCMGDSGGPALREAGGKVELVAVNSRSAQGGCYGIDAAVTSTAAIDSRVDDVRAWVDAKVGAPRITDFNCDGAEDIAVGDPKATVGGKTTAGLVRVVYGGGKGTAELTQDLDSVPGAAEASDWFGEELAVFDRNEDGCTDLVVGVPAEDIGTTADAGSVTVLFGAPDGLTKGQAALTLEQGTGTGAVKASASEAGDRMGHAIAAGHTASGEPYLLIGVPGEDTGTNVDAGNTFYLRGSVNVSVGQDSPGVPGEAEKGDRFGTSVSGSPNHIVVGSPQESVGTNAASGSVTVLKHTLSADGIPAPVAAIDQDTTGISGSAEADDEFGNSVSAVAYRPSGAPAATDSIIAVGSPGEAISVNGANRTDAGRVVTLRVTAAGAFSELADIGQDAVDVADATETGDRFGAKVSAVNTAPGAVSTTAGLRLAVGVPGEAIGTVKSAGAVQTFSLLGTPGDADSWLAAGSGLPGTSGANQLVGNAIHTTGTQLYVGMPNGPATYGAVYALPWAAGVGTTGAVTTYQPGQNGLPAAGLSFGVVMR